MQKFLRGGTYLILIATPLIFWNKLESAFQLPKVSFVRIMVAMLLIGMVTDIIVKAHKKRPIELPQTFRQNPIISGVFAFAMALTIVTMFSPNFEISFFGSHERYSGLLTHLHYIALFAVAFYAFDSREHLKKILYTISLGGTFAALYGVCQQFGFDPFFGDWDVAGFLGRLFGTLGQPNFLAQFLLVTIGTTATVLAIDKKEYGMGWMIFWAISLLGQLDVLLFTKSRAALLGLFAAVAIFALLQRRHHILTGRKKTVAKVTALFLVGALLIMAVHSSRTGTETPLRSLSLRLALWPQAVHVWLEEPLFGHGLDTFRFTSTKYMTPENLEFESYTGIADRSHNEFLDYLIHGGILLFFAYLLLIVSLFTVSYRHARAHPKDAPYILPVLATLGGLNVALFFSFSTVTLFVVQWALFAYLTRFAMADQPVERLKVRHGLALASGALLSLALLAVVWFWDLRPLYANYVYKLAAEQTETYSLREYMRKRAATLSPQESFYREQLAEFYLNTGENGAAAGVAKMHAVAALELSSERNAFAWADIGAAAARSGEIETARYALEKAIEYAPIHPLVVQSAARAYIEMDDPATAHAILERLINASPPYWMWEEDLASRSPQEIEKYRVFFKDYPFFQDILKMWRETAPAQSQ